MDTTSLLYAGISAEKSNKRDEALIYYKTIADSGITRIGGNDMAEIYKWLADYYTRSGDKAMADKYTALGKSHYPKDIFYDELQLDVLRKNGPKDSLFAKYEEINRDHPDSAIYFFNYGLELYQTATDSSKGKVPANAAELIKRSQEKLLACLKLTPNYPQANLVMGQIAYNEGVEYQVLGKPKGNTNAAELKQRQDYRAMSAKKFDEAIPYLEKVDQVLGTQTKLKKADKVIVSNLQAHISFLADDKLEGRRAGTNGEKLAREYISAQFQKSGLQPKGENNSWYQPFEINEDYLIESILDKAFNRGRLVPQKAANPVDIDELTDYWEQKAKKQ